MSSVVIEAKNLSKNFSHKAVLQGLTFQVQRGECFGFIGPHKAGKSTLMKILCGFFPLSKGELYILGKNAYTHSQKIKESVGVVPEEDRLDIDFNVLENLSIYASYFSIPRKKASLKIEKILRVMGLSNYRYHLAHHLSEDIKRHLTISRALINDPEILFLDEPTLNLDPHARYSLWNILENKLDSINEQKRTVVLATQSTEEAEKYCDRIALIDRGKLLAQGVPSQLIHTEVGERVAEFSVKPSELTYYAERIKNRFNCTIIENKIHLFFKTNEERASLLETIPAYKIVFRRASLEDVFLKLAGYELKGKNKNFFIEKEEKEKNRRKEQR